MTSSVEEMTAMAATLMIESGAQNPDVIVEALNALNNTDRAKLAFSAIALGGQMIAAEIMANPDEEGPALTTLSKFQAAYVAMQG